MEPATETVPTPRRGRWLLVAVLLLAVVAFYAAGLNGAVLWEFIRTNLANWQAQSADNPGLVVVVFMAVYIVSTALSLPVALFLTLLAGALFGRGVGVLVASVSATLGATLAFLSARYVLRDWVRMRFGPRLAALDEGVRREGGYYLFTLRLVPFVPYFLVNLGMGLTAIPLSTYVLVSWVGMLPAAFVLVNVGTELSRLESTSGLLSWQLLTAFALVGVAPLLLRKLVTAFGRSQRDDGEK